MSVNRNSGDTAGVASGKRQGAEVTVNGSAGRIKIVGLGGSLDGSSNSLAALEVAMRSSERAGAEIVTFDLHALQLPLYEPSKAETPCVRELVEAMHGADGLLWSSPLYHGTISGAFKNALDWLELLRNSEPAYLTDKPVGLISTAGGAQGLQAINTMEYIVRSLRGWTVPLTAPVSHAWHAFDEHGNAKDEAVNARLAAVGHEVVRAARLFTRHIPVPPDVEAQEDAERE
jgi:FMN reductase